MNKLLLLVGILTTSLVSETPIVPKLGFKEAYVPNQEQRDPFYGEITQDHVNGGIFASDQEKLYYINPVDNPDESFPKIMPVNYEGKEEFSGRKSPVTFDDKGNAYTLVIPDKDPKNRYIARSKNISDDDKTFVYYENYQNAISAPVFYNGYSYIPTIHDNRFSFDVMKQSSSKITILQLDNHAKSLN